MPPPAEPELFGSLSGEAGSAIVFVRHAAHLGFLFVIARSMHEYAVRPLVDSLGFYGAYHQDPVNQAIHFVFVPTLLWSFLIYFSHYSLPIEFSIAGHPITYASVISAAYVAFYLSIDPFGGAMYSLVVAALYLSASGMVASERRAVRKKHDDSRSGSGRAMRTAGVLQLLGWYMQLHPGHAVFEKVKPALIDGFGQSFSVAPLFAFYEGAWAAGLHGELHKQTQVEVARRRAEMCRAGGKFHFC